MVSRLHPGDEVRFARCGAWYVVSTRAGSQDHPYVSRMLYFDCRGDQYFAGLIGGAARLQVRCSEGTKQLLMRFHVVQPYTDKPDRPLRAIVVRSFDTAAEAFAELERIGDRLHGFDLPGDTIEMLVVDEQRRPVQRRDAH
jgi:hypothetical protein